MHRLFTEDGLTIGTVAVSASTWLVGKLPTLGQSSVALESGGIVVATIGLAALIVRTYGEAHKVRAAERLRVLDHAHIERLAALDRDELRSKIAKLEARAEYERRMCASGVCPWPNRDGSARCDGADQPLSLEQAPIVLRSPLPSPDHAASQGDAP
jgi:hypothetical protein